MAMRIMAMRIMAMRIMAMRIMAMIATVELVCEQCKQPYRVKRYKEHTSRFCSRLCLTEWKKILEDTYTGEF